MECVYKTVVPFPECRLKCVKDALDLINRQKVEIERLEKEKDSRLITCIAKDIETAKSEAIKEFAERLKSRLRFYYQNQGMLEKEFCLIHIDKAVKEMTEVER